MFGRRNPDRPLDNQTMPLNSDLDLDMLDDLPDIQAADPAKPPTRPPAEPQADDLAWQAATPSMLGPSVTQLLREAEAAPQQRPVDDGLSPLFGSAPMDTTQYSAYMSETPSATAPLIEDDPIPSSAYTFALPAAEAPAEPLPAEAPISEPAPAPAPLPAPVRAPVVAPAARARTVAESVIGPDDFFDGRYRSERGVRIQGNARGSIESRQYIYVEAGAQVEADLSAEEITIAGDFTGKIACRGRLEVTSSGKIQGQVETALLVVQEGGAIDGQLSMRKNADPAA
jgi:cytoskeletal protein CcmA (bactofilin family)